MVKLEVLKKIAVNLENSNYNDILSLLKKLNLSYVMQFDIPAGNFITRIRKSEKIPFHSESEISYKPKPTKYNRANRPNQPMFYGSVEVPGMIKSIDTNVWEWLHTFDRAAIYTNEPIEFTVGSWEIQENLPTIPIIYNKVFISKNKLFDPLIKKYEKDNRITEISREIIDFLAREFAKSKIKMPSEYKITAAFCELILHRLNGKIESILYPSVRTQGGGYNIAITPKFVSKYLKLKKVGTFIMYRDKDKVLLDWERITEDISENGIFKLPDSPDLEISKGGEWCAKELSRLANV